MSEKTLNLTWLYPDLLNLHGDRGNVMAFERVAKAMGIDVVVKRVDTFSEEIDFENSDIIFMNVGEIKSVAPIAQNIRKYGDAIYNYVEKGKTLIAIGTTGAVLASKLQRLDGCVVEGLSILNMTCSEREFIYGDDLHFKLNDEKQTEIVAVQIHLLDFMLDDSSSSLGNVIYGKGNNDNDRTEGARKKNVFFTNALGPVFVKNPWFTRDIIELTMNVKGEDVPVHLENDYFKLEKNSAQAIKKFILDKTGN